MKFLQTFFILFLITISNIPQLQSFSSSDQTFFSELKKSSFGLTLLKSIHLQVKLHSSLKQILSMLQTMRSNLLEEDTTEISENLNTQSECTSDLTSLKSSIESAQSQYETDQRDLETATINLNTVQDQLLEAESFKTSKTNELTLLKEQRSNEKIAFEASEDEISNALNSLYNGKKILKQLIEDFSFLQNKKNNKKTLLFQFQDSMQETLVSQSGIRGLMNYFSKMLQTPEIQSDQTLIKRVIDLIDLLIAKLNEDSEKEQQAENTRVEVFEREELGLEGEISGLMSQINDLTESIRILGDSIVNLKQDEKNQSDIQKEKEEELDIKRKSCGDLQRNFEMRSQNRKEEIKIIEETIEIFETRFDNVKEYLNDMEISSLD